MNKAESTKTSPWKKESYQWLAILLVAATLYASGWHTEVIGRLQSILLFTGLFEPATVSPPPAGQTTADYRLSMLSLDGEFHQLKEFEGQTIFMNVWATWCPPCIAEMPNIQKLYDEMPSGDIRFVMLSIDEDPDKVQSFIERKEFTFPVYILSGGLPRSFQSPVVPTTYVIAPDGRIVMKHEGMASYHSEEFQAYLLSISDE